jgi:AraC-like DNA-binding protein
VNDYCLPHFHSSIEIVYVISGEIKATLNGQLFNVKQKDFLIVPSYTIHAYTTEVSSKSYIFTIPLDTISSFKSILSKKTFASLLVENPHYCKELIHCLDSICTLSELSIIVDDSKEDTSYFVDANLPNDMDSLLHENTVKGYTYVILGLLIKQVGLIDIQNAKITSLAQDILIYLQDNYLKLLSLEDISDRFGYSKSRFSHIFNQYFGCKLVEYINGLRCRYALELLQEKSTTITEIALASGFDSTRTFYRAFQKCFGCTPSQYLMK